MTAPERDVRRRWENDALAVVEAVKRDLVPAMDTNDGGQLLVWILDLCEKVAAAPSPSMAEYRFALEQIRDGSINGASWCAIKARHALCAVRLEEPA